MAAALPVGPAGRRVPAAHVVREPRWVRRVLVGLALLFVGLFVALPLGVVFAEAFRRGASAWARSVTDPRALDAIRLTLTVTLVALPVNVVFGIAAAWLVARFRFPGRSALVALIELPFAVSPVVAGMIFVLLFGAHGWFGAFLAAHGVRIVFAVPGIVLATTFVTLPFIARELVPLMEAQGAEEEEAAVVLGAGAFMTFVKVTLPNVRWGLLYGVILCTARAMGEFGAVSVVSGHVRGETSTMTLEIESLYDEYAFSSAFALASLLTLLAVVSLVLRRIAGGRAWRNLAVNP